MISLFVTILSFVFFSGFSPVSYIYNGIKNLPENYQFAQITKIDKSLPKTNPSNLSELDPLSSLDNITAPLDSIWKALGLKLGIDGLGDLFNATASKQALDLTQDKRIDVRDTFDSLWDWRILGIVKSAFILAGQILLVVLEIAVGALKAILSILR